MPTPAHPAGKPPGTAIAQFSRPSAPTLPTGPLVNGSFELGRNIGWTEYSLRQSQIVTTTQPYTGRYVTPLSGDWAAWIDGLDDEANYLAQTFTVPDDRAFLTFWMQIRSEEDAVPASERRS